MTWFNGKILTADEIGKARSQPIPSLFQIGNKVSVHFFEEDETAYSIDGVVVGVTIGDWHEVKYDIAFQVKAGVYVRIDGFRGYVTADGEKIDSNGDLIEIKKTPLSIVSCIDPTEIVEND